MRCDICNKTFRSMATFS
ncbi:hypothetical protein DKK69_05290 [Gilliamella apicola]|nr:hypothetical protein DKK69_05290 [Gilliamella apicola]